MLYSLLIVVDVLLAVAVVSLILLNRGHGAEVGAVFGGSASPSSMFGSKGSTSFITRVIAVLAGLFLLNSLGLAYLANFQYIQKSVIDKVEVESPLQSREPVDAADDVPDDYGDPEEVIPEAPN